LFYLLKVHKQIISLKKDIQSIKNLQKKLSIHRRKMNYYKQNDSKNIHQIPAHHEGKGTFDVCPLFDQDLKIPIKTQIWELSPGATEGMHHHSDNEALEEFYYFLEGTGTMWVGNEKFSVISGDAVLIPQNIDHGFENTGNKKLKLLIIWGKPKK
jgi:mannose-6-phosphate isomerase-like protein (cupin superfamily)